MELLDRVKKYLRPNGQIIASIPNVMHYSIVESLLSGKRDYSNSGILDKTHLMFFNLSTITDMFEKNGYLIEQTDEIISPQNITGNKKNLLKYLHVAIPPKIRNELLVYQYIVKAKCKF